MSHPQSSLLPVLLLALGVGGCARGVSVSEVERPPVARAAGGGGPFTGDLAALRSPDFVTRQRAAERLVAAGETALGALGAAGEQPVPGLAGRGVSTTRPVVDAILQDLPAEHVRTHLAGPWSVVRRAAATELGRRGGLGAVPELIARLTDDDVEVRIAAVAALRRLTNRYFGFAPRATVVARREAEARWRSWWLVEGKRRADREDQAAG